MRALFVVALVCSGTALLAQEDQLPHGMEIGPAIKKVSQWIGPDQAPSDKPWANDLADLTDSDPGRHEPAIVRLADHGRRSPRVVDDLTILAGDRDPRIRSRVTLTLSGIGGASAAPLLIQLSRDRERLVREQAVIGLARCATDPSVDRLVELLQAPESTVREQAARALGALRAVRSLAPLVERLGDRDDLARREKRQALRRVADQSEAINDLITQLTASEGETRDALLEVAAAVRDRRLVPVVTAIAADPTTNRTRSASAWTQFLALRALSTGGDRRALATICHLADAPGSDEVRRAAAEAGVALTGYTAQPGKAWAIWWNDHAPLTARWNEIDGFIARLHDPAVSATRPALSGFTTDELMPLVDAVLETDAQRTASWWPAQALAALRADDPTRWSAVLATRCTDLPSAQSRERLGLILLIDDLGGPTAADALAAIAKDLETRTQREKKDQIERKISLPDHAAEESALSSALKRRGR